MHKYVAFLAKLIAVYLDPGNAMLLQCLVYLYGNMIHIEPFLQPFENCGLNEEHIWKIIILL